MFKLNIYIHFTILISKLCSLFRGYSKNATALETDLLNQSPYIKASFAILAVGIASVANVISSDLGDKLNQVFAVVKVAAISVICCIGVYWLAKGY